jgi:hypothetical protein
MKSLGFSSSPPPPGLGVSGRRLKEARFESRSSLPISAACVVANGVRETLSSLLALPVTLRLFAPSIPAPQAWQAILREARLYRVAGNAGDAAIVLRRADASALSAALFGESAPAPTQRALSPIECDVLDRMVGAVAANFAAVCGTREEHAVERVSALGGFVTYFELSIEEPLIARIGVALSRDPSPEARGPLGVAHLAGIELDALATLDLGSAKAATVARLAVGATLPIEPAALQRCTLAAQGQRLAHGGSGVRNGRYAMRVDAVRSAV